MPKKKEIEVVDMPEAPTRGRPKAQPASKESLEADRDKLQAQIDSMDRKDLEVDFLKTAPDRIKKLEDAMETVVSNIDEIHTTIKILIEQGKQ